MRKLIVSEFVTLDGVMQAPGLPDEDRSGGFEHGGWQQKYFDPLFGKKVLETLGGAGGLLLGRKTYEIFAGYWPKQPKGDPFASLMNGLPKHVVSTTLREPLGWEKSSLLTGDAAAAVGRLKEQGGKELVVIGSGRLVQSLLQNRLVDELRLMVHPLILGTGKVLFGDVPPATLELVDSEASSTGVVLLTYRAG